MGDTFASLKQLALAVREAWGGKIAGVTGSVGKTTTKEILAALLGAKLRVLKSEGNFNNEYGLPLTLFRLEETHQAVVLEMGMSRRGELARLARDLSHQGLRRDRRQRPLNCGLRFSMKARRPSM